MQQKCLFTLIVWECSKWASISTFRLCIIILSMWMQQNYFLYFASNLSSSGCNHTALLFANKVQKTCLPHGTLVHGITDTDCTRTKWTCFLVTIIVSNTDLLTNLAINGLKKQWPFNKPGRKWTEKLLPIDFLFHPYLHCLWYCFTWWPFKPPCLKKMSPLHTVPFWPPSSATLQAEQEHCWFTRGMDYWQRPWYVFAWRPL